MIGCGIRLRLPSSEATELTLIGMYLPCADLWWLQAFCDNMVELERLVSECQIFGPVPVLIAGDFNVHLGSLGSSRGQGDPNHQGTFFSDSSLIAVGYMLCLSSLSEGPTFTFWKAEVQTIVDHIIVSQHTSHYIKHCFTYELVPLNTSDHLPISIVQDIPIINEELSLDQLMTGTKQGIMALWKPTRSWCHICCWVTCTIILNI